MTDTATITKTTEVVATPAFWTVVFHNDDHTPMEFVVDVLIRHFRKELGEAVRVMLKIHTEGLARVGTYTRDVAETKAAEVVAEARLNGFPLLAVAEKS